MSGTVGKSGVVGPSIGWGTLFGAAVAIVLLFYGVESFSMDRTQHPDYALGRGDAGLLVGLFATPVVIVGGAAGAVLFGIVGVIVRFGPRWLAASPLSYAVLGSLVWAAVCWLRALNLSQDGATGADFLIQAALLRGGAEAAYSLTFYGLAPVAIAGLLTGGLVRSGRRHAYRTSRPGVN